MPFRRKGKGASRPSASQGSEKGPGRKTAEKPSKRVLKVTGRHITASVAANTRRRQAKRDKS